MRARLAIELSTVKIEYREILLRDKPPEMLKASPKGTVPVLILNNKQVIEESLDIVYWALKQNDPYQMLDSNILNSANELIEINDNRFKSQLDKYKYAVRFPEQAVETYRENCDFFLKELDTLLNKNKFLLGSSLGLADIAIFPFIRQFSFVDKAWFNSINYPYLKKWLNVHLESDLFINIMEKRDIWCSN